MIRHPSFISLAYIMSSTSRQHRTDLEFTLDDGVTPLLQDHSESITTPPKVTPLPKLQLFIAIFIQVAEPVTSTVIYPIVNDLIRSIGITHGDEKKTGYYVGIVESIFYAAECLTVMHWGRASDIIGRKPILLGGMAGLALSMFSFGLSKNYWMLLISRAAQGAFNGNVGVTKSVMAEITDATNAPQAFAFLPVAWSVGSTLGPAIGGAFVNVDIFGKAGFFKSFPYFLPCFVAALVPICAFTLAFVALKETAPLVVRRRKEREVKCDLSIVIDHQVSHPKNDTSKLLPCSGPSYGTLAYKDQQTPSSPASTTTCSSSRSPLPRPQEKPTFRSILIPQVLIPITNFAFLAFLDQCVLVLIPLIYSTPVELGGLNLGPSQIGSILGIWGVINGFIQVFCFARVRRILGHRTTYIIGIVGMGIVFAFFPILSALVMWDGGRVSWSVYVGIALQLASYSFSYMSYACMFLYIAAAAPSRSALGTTNGLAQLTASGTRAIAPTAASSLFALSLTLRGGTSITGGYMVYIVLNLITAVAVFWSTRLPRELRQRDD
ncbi:major facilitator superfamily domain-containing protein [Collybia nuda]|uniref:Major facilitator superfamily domain-containing protein n=1 Tax=Collybia nuda TaxID=64659 RepID=A0A9P5Y4Z0_9AGAR|nr:major facilitator superfamily domain-containing protein [Collybia nuda]